MSSVWFRVCGRSRTRVSTGISLLCAHCLSLPCLWCGLVPTLLSSVLLWGFMQEGGHEIEYFPISYVLSVVK